jgi:IS6 family transposase
MSPSEAVAVPLQTLNSLKAKQGFREFQAAQRTIQGYEAMHMIGKGQARWVSGSDIRRQNQFVNQLFELA